MTKVQYIHLTFKAPNGEGDVECPTLGDPASRYEINRAARRAFYSLVHAGYGDLTDVKLFPRGQPVPVGPGTGN